MYSKAKIFGHPIHPMLVGFPVAFYAASCVSYIAYAVGGVDVVWFKLAYFTNVAGVISAVIAAVPGFIDWALGIPTGSRAKMTGMIHMFYNIVALILFGVSAVLNYSQMQLATPHATMGVVLTLLGVGATLIGGFLGWKMVGTHHVGIDLSPEQERWEPLGQESSPRLRSGTGS